MVIAEFMAREPLPRELIRLGPGNYIYGGERVEVSLHPRAGRKPKLKAINTRFNAGQPLSLRRFANLFEEQFTPAPSPEKAERHSIMRAPTSSDMKMEERRGSAAHQIMEETQGAPSSEAARLSSKFAEAERRISMQLAQHPSEQLAITNGRRSRASSVAAPAQALMALEAPEMGRDSGMVTWGSRGRSKSVAAAVSGGRATGKARSASVSHAPSPGHLGGSPARGERSQSMVASGRERSATVPALSAAGHNSSRPQITWRERLESATDGSFVIQEQRSRSASLAVPGGPMLAIAGPMPMPMLSRSGGGVRQRSASVAVPSPRSGPDPLGRSRSATVSHGVRLAAPSGGGSVSAPLGVQVPLGMPTALSPRSSPDLLGVTVLAVQPPPATSAPMLFANSAGRQTLPVGRSFTFTKPQGRNFLEGIVF